MTNDDMFNAVMDEAESIARSEIKYCDSWVSKLDGDYEQRILRETGKYSGKAECPKKSI